MRIVIGFCLAVITLIVGGSASPLFAQCDPTMDVGCVDSDGLGPDISITPSSATYTVDAGTTQAVVLTIRATDADGVNRDSLKITLSSSAGSEQVPGFEWNATSGNTYAFGQVTVRVGTAGENIVTAQLADRGGKIGIARATFQISVLDPALPIVSLAPHHDAFRDTSIGALSTRYAMPGYTSMDAERAIGLYYDSERAAPTGFVQLDVDIDYRARTEYDGGAVTLQIFQDGPEPRTAVTSQDAWAINPGAMKQRVAAQWSTKHLPTGAYQYWADVRVYRQDKTTYKSRMVPIRILVVNESASRYGAGWSLSGVQRMYVKSAGIVLTEGSSAVRYFARSGCTSTGCTWRTPEGDFSTVTFDAVNSQYIRTYVNQTRVTFSVKGLMTSLTDRFGRTTKLEWIESPDAQKEPLLARVTDPVGKVTTLTYQNGYLKEITDPVGRIASFAFNTAGDLIRIVGPMNVEAGYDASHRLTSYTSDAQWDIAYDARGMLRTITAPAVNIAGRSVVRPVTTFDSLQMMTTLASWATHIQYNWAAAVPSDQVFMSVSDPAGHVTRIELDRYGNRTRIIDPIGNFTTSRYNEHGLPLSISSPSHSEAYGWSSRGLLLTKTVNGTLVYQASYGSSDLPDFETIGTSVVRWFRYGPRGELLRVWSGSRADGDTNATVYAYDAEYRLIKATSPTGEQREWSYDEVWKNTSEDRLLRRDGTLLRTTFAYDEAGRVKSSTDPLGRTTLAAYDQLNRPTRITNPQQRTMEIVYRGKYPESLKDTAGKVYSFAYNALGWLERETFPDGKSRRFAYDIDGLLSKSTDRRDAVVERSYDTGHRLVSLTADGAQTTFSYSGFDAIVTKNAEVQETVEFHWAVPLGRKTTLAFPGGKTYVVELGLSDSSAYSPTQLTVQRYANDTLTATDSIRFSENYYPENPELSRILNIQDFGGRTTSIEYDKQGRAIRTLYPNGVIEAHSFTDENLLRTLRFTAPSLAATVGGTLNTKLGADYGYDVMGRLTSRGGAAGDIFRSYRYDEIGQLVEFHKTKTTTEPGCDPAVTTCGTIQTPVTSESYSYDAAGNRTDRGATLEANSNRYRTFNGYTLEYDAEGNLTRKYKTGFEQNLTWDALGRLTSVTTNGTLISYGYSPSGKRIRRTATGSRYFIYHQNNLIMELDGLFNPSRSYTYRPGIDRPLNVRETSGTVHTMYDYVLEYPGHVAALLDKNGGVAAQYEYAPFGTETSTNDGRLLRFMARERDSSSGLYYLRNRWYDPVTARFISEDPIGFAGGPNFYAYAGNDPINARDPMGLQKEPCGPGTGTAPSTCCETSCCCAWRDPALQPNWDATLHPYVSWLHAPGSYLLDTSRSHCYDGSRPDPSDQCRGITPIPTPTARQIREEIRQQRIAAREQCEQRQAAKRPSIEGEFGRNFGWNAALNLGRAAFVGAGGILGSAGGPVGTFLGAVAGAAVAAGIETIGNELLSPCGAGLF